MKSQLRRSLKASLDLLLFSDHTMGIYAGKVPESSFEIIFMEKSDQFFIRLDIYPAQCFDESIHVLESFFETDCIGEILRELEVLNQKPARSFFFSVNRRYYHKLTSINAKFFVYNGMIYYNYLPLKYIERIFDSISEDYNDSIVDERNTNPTDILQHLFEDADAFGVKTICLNSENVFDEEFVDGSLTIEEFYTTTAGDVKSLDGYYISNSKIVCLIVVKGGNPGGVLM